MTAQPSNFEQLVLELINRARADPVGEIDRLILQDAPVIGAEPEITSALNFFDVDIALLRAQLAGADPVAPLGWNEALGVSSTTHSQLMLEFEEQSHFLPGEPGIADRFIDAGYTGLRRAGENIFAFTESPLHGHAGFYVDWGFGPGGMQDPAGHRINILHPDFTEAGIGVLENVASTTIGPHVMTQHFGDRSGDNPKLTGVVIDDRDGDDFYDIGEGLGGVQVRAVAGALTFTTVTYASGGYTLDVPSGTWSVSFSGGALDGTVARTVTVSASNVKLDVELDDAAVPVPDGPLVGDDLPNTLIGTADPERIVGGGGDDLLRGLGGDDTLEGDDGNDRLVGDSGADALAGGGGADMASYAGSPLGVRVVLSKNVANRGDAAGDQLTGIENVLGSARADLLSGDEARNLLSGGGDTDVLLGRGGDDRLIGGAGDDRLRGDAGGDRLDGGEGSDMAMYSDSRAGIAADLSTGRASGGSAAGDALTGIESLRGSRFGDRLTGDGAGNLLDGRGGDDRIAGGAGADRILGGDGDDILTGGAGADRFLFLGRCGGADRVTDFDDGADRLQLGRFGLDFADLAISSDAGGTTIAFLADGEPNVIRLDGVDAALIDAADFIM